MQRLVRAPVRGEDDLVHLGVRHKLEQPQPVGRHAKRLRGGVPERPRVELERQQLRQQQRQVRLVKRAGRADQVAQVPAGALAVAGKAVGRLLVQPAAGAHQPARRREMVKRHHRPQPVLVAGRQHPPVVFELGIRKLALLRLDARPLDRKAVGVKPQLRQQRDIRRVPVIVVARIPRRLDINRPRQMLQHPRLAVDIVPFHLVRRRRRAPQKACRKLILFHASPSSLCFLLASYHFQEDTLPGSLRRSTQGC